MPRTLTFAMPVPVAVLRLVVGTALLPWLLVSCATTPATVPRPQAWADALLLDGVPNLFRVSDELYRSAQPQAPGMVNLQGLGVRTVVNLRSFHSDRAALGDTGLGYEHLYMKAWHPQRHEAVRFLSLFAKRSVCDAGGDTRTPVLVHCQHGADRTGAMCALYRIVVQGWSKDAAIEEMTGGGFGFHEVWANLPRWLRELDTEKLAVDAGLRR